MTGRAEIGRFGIWRSASLVTPEIAAGIERLGFGVLWLGSSPDGDLEQAEALLDATTALMLATSIVNMWKDQAGLVARSYARVQRRHPGRFVLGVGAGHREATQQYARPYETLARYVDDLVAGGVPRDGLVLAALGPRVLRLAGGAAAGAIPYLVPPEHTAQARALLGPGPLLAPEHKVVLDTDPARARALGRSRVRTPYLGLVNYTSNLRRLGWADSDLAGEGSDALIDALVAHGSAGQVAAQLARHLDAGADHVCIQLLTPGGTTPLDGYRALADALQLGHRGLRGPLARANRRRVPVTESRGPWLPALSGCAARKPALRALRRHQLADRALPHRERGLRPERK
jgi:probable F420-dependent oxidoreductase